MCAKWVNFMTYMIPKQNPKKSSKLTQEQPFEDEVLLLHVVTGLLRLP